MCKNRCNCQLCELRKVLYICLLHIPQHVELWVVAATCLWDASHHHMPEAWKHVSIRRFNDTCLWIETETYTYDVSNNVRSKKSSRCKQTWRWTSRVAHMHLSCNPKATAILKLVMLSMSCHTCNTHPCNLTTNFYINSNAAQHFAMHPHISNAMTTCKTTLTWILQLIDSCGRNPLHPSCHLRRVRAISYKGYPYMLHYCVSKRITTHCEPHTYTPYSKSFGVLLNSMKRLINQWFINYMTLPLAALPKFVIIYMIS